MQIRPIFGVILVALLLGTGLTACPRAAAQASIGSFSISSPTLSFPSLSPETTASLAALQNPILLSFSVSGTISWILEAETTTDLTCGGSTIPIDSLTWTSGSPNFDASGTMQKNMPTQVASGMTSGAFSGAISYFLANRWTAPAGTYTSTITYTLIAL